MKFKLVLAALAAAVVGYVVFAGGDSTDQIANYGPKSKFSGIVGKPAPNFTLTSYSGETFTLDQLRGKKVILFFSEGIMCYPACWNQIAALGTDKRLNTSDIVTFSIVPDQKDSWNEAIGKMPDLGKENILLDANHAVSIKYDTLNLPSSMHRGVMPGHTYFLVDQKGIIRYTYDDPKMAIRNDMLFDEISKI